MGKVTYNQAGYAGCSMSERAVLAYECDVKRGNHLHMDDVTQDTPCGMYWFELDEA